MMHGCGPDHMAGAADKGMNRIFQHRCNFASQSCSAQKQRLTAAARWPDHQHVYP